MLITSCGGLVGTYLIKHLAQTGKYELIGTDMTNWVSQKDKLTAFYRTSAVDDPAYTDEMEQIVKQEQIDVIVPVSSYDMNIYTKREMQNRLFPAKMLLMDSDMHQMLHDKKASSAFLKGLGIRTPKVLKEEEGLRFPCILKANKSSGSKNVVLLEEKADYIYWKNKIADYTIFEYLEGKEYTVDCLFDRNGRCVGYNPRERVKTSGGGAVISVCVMEKRLPDTIRKLETCGRIKGAVNFQYKVIDGELCIFDFNTRLASGGLPLSVKAGFDIPQMLLDLIQDKMVEVWLPSKEKEDLCMLRYYEEIYVRD